MCHFPLTSPSSLAVSINTGLMRGAACDADERTRSQTRAGNVTEAAYRCHNDDVAVVICVQFTSVRLANCCSRNLRYRIAI